MRILLIILAGPIVLIGSFWLTLQVIDHWPQRELSGFEIAMDKEGVTMTGQITEKGSITGYIDSVERDATGRIALSGWAYDTETSQPVVVAMYLDDAKFERIAITQGARDDVAAALGLSREKTKNVAFNGRTEQPLECGLSSAMVVAFNQKRHLSIIAPNLEVPRCRR